MKINKSQLAREYGVDRRTIDKFLNSYIKTNKRNKQSKVDKFYDEIKSLLSEDSIQKFYYKRVLWRYLLDNHGLDCSASNFRAYISKRPEFQSYFDANSGRVASSNRAVVRYETPPAEQAQLDWKEDIKYITNDGEIIHVNILVLTLSFSRLKVYQISLSKSQTILLSINKKGASKAFWRAFKRRYNYYNILKYIFSRGWAKTPIVNGLSFVQ